MPTDLIALPTLAAEPPADLIAMTTDALRGELAAQMRLSAEALLRMAWIVRLLEDRGEDLSQLRGGLMDHLRRIAAGQLLPELVVRFAGAPLALQRAALLPLSEQRSLAAGEKVLLVVRREGAFDHRLASPLQMTRGQLWQVFGPAGIRNETEQQLLLEGKPDKPPPPMPQGRAKPDRARGGLVVGRTFLPHAEVLRALADLRGPAPDDGAAACREEEAAVPVKLTREEHRRLKVASANATASAGENVTMQDLCWQALRAAGLI